MSVTLPSLSVNQTVLSVTSIRLVPNMDFQTVRDDSLTVPEVLVALTDWVLELRKFVTDRPETETEKP